ncbi:HypC/HybG/HupF family hydrogenase formation chaperone [Magnetospirillum fulvum]|uniref:Hydrogenase maturation factor HypC n=1 Tax=Magnetospirillum fulvum TaxID=1082 RepID=A0A1H6HHP2_MAGFU|nr:HypC/HybG/HupF family hydrogenase formation chaperone [Magnetospirillum fulvum]SEH35309.1 Hydrogenase maturation protein HypC [Magnetospirillum fulvum]
MCLAIPAEVIDLLPDEMARVSLDGIVKTISVGLLDEVAVGDYVVVHVGHALARIDEAEARRTLALIAEMGQMAAEAAR